MSIGSGIAVTGIWIGVAIGSFAAEAACVPLAVAAAFATLFVCAE